nr:MAG TPA: hypothetical protein [Caudoviricetes sp.]
MSISFFLTSILILDCIQNFILSRREIISFSYIE